MKTQSVVLGYTDEMSDLIETLRTCFDHMDNGLFRNQEKYRALAWMTAKQIVEQYNEETL